MLIVEAEDKRSVIIGTYIFFESNFAERQGVVAEAVDNVVTVAFRVDERCINVRIAPKFIVAFAARDYFRCGCFERCCRAADAPSGRIDFRFIHIVDNKHIVFAVQCNGFIVNPLPFHQDRTATKTPS